MEVLATLLFEGNTQGVAVELPALCRVGNDRAKTGDEQNVYPSDSLHGKRSPVVSICPIQFPLEGSFLASLQTPAFQTPAHCETARPGEMSGIPQPIDYRQLSAHSQGNKRQTRV